MSKHDHHFMICSHTNVKYCSVCRLTYCTECGKEWVEYTTYYNTIYYPQINEGISWRNATITCSHETEEKDNG